MSAQSGQFSRLGAVRVPPDRGSQAFCGGAFSAVTPQSGRRPDLPPPIQYRRGITRTGELDGAKEADGG
jgi:hypothetical protein